jgi:DNA-binding IclR family transcriptional regulator
MELADVVELPKSTVHRLVTALAREQLVSTGRNGWVSLGSGLPRLAAATREALRERLRPVLERLARELDETVDLAVLDGDAVRFVDQVPAGHHRLRAVSAVGAAFPLYCTANGKALLASMPREQVIALVPERLPMLTVNTIPSLGRVGVELAQIRRAQGVAFDREEHTEGICATGAAIFDSGGAVAAISVPVPTPRFRGHEDRYASAVKAAASEASRILSR